MFGRFSSKLFSLFAFSFLFKFGRFSSKLFLSCFLFFSSSFLLLCGCHNFLFNGFGLNNLDRLFFLFLGFFGFDVDSIFSTSGCRVALGRLFLGRHHWRHLVIFVFLLRPSRELWLPVQWSTFVFYWFCYLFG